MTDIHEADTIDAPSEMTLRQRIHNNAWWLAVAATLFLALWLWREFAIRVAKEDAISQQAEITRLSAVEDRLSQQLEKVSSELAALASAHFQTVTLAGQKPAPMANGKLFVDTREKRAVAFFYNLPVTAAGEEFHVWIATADGKFANGGAFTMTRTGRASLLIDQVPADAKSFVVTLEKNGATEPSSQTSYLSGSL